MLKVSSTIATTLGLGGFACAAGASALAGNPPETSILRGMGAMLVCYLIGGVLGDAADAILREHGLKYRLDNPAPDAEGVHSSAEGPEPGGDALLQSANTGVETSRAP